MNEKKIAHLQIIQSVVTRLSSNSFLLRGWTVTLVAASFALAAKDTDITFIFIAYLPAVTFWALDGYYLSRERRFRQLYASVASKGEDEIDFSMDIRQVKESWSAGVCSVTNLVFYGAIVSAILVVMLAFPSMESASQPVTR